MWKGSNFMLDEIIFLIQESSEGGYEAKALGHAIFTEAETMSELRLMIKDAVNCHFELHQKPAMIRLHEVRDEVIPA